MATRAQTTDKGGDAPKNLSTAAGTSPAAEAFARCQDINQKVDLLIQAVVNLCDDGQGEALLEAVEAVQGAKSGQRHPYGGPPSEDPGITGKLPPTPAPGSVVPDGQEAEKAGSNS